MVPVCVEPGAMQSVESRPCSYFVWQPGSGTCTGYSECREMADDHSAGGSETVAYRRAEQSWKLIMRQSLPAFLSQEKWRSVNAGNPESQQHSALDTMEDHRSADGNFRFKLVASCPSEGKSTINPHYHLIPRNVF